MEILFEISDIECQYTEGKTVLKIPKLVIPRGKLVVILGSSGAGKSTLLELLGLMSNTLTLNSMVKFYPGQVGLEYNIGKLWSSKGHLEINNVRRKHFSFIFQHTNLMPNFSALENAIVPMLLQGTIKGEAIERVFQYARLLNLNEADLNKKTFELSGGQRQRLAFIRAISTDFTVLFGDEPTGNLDEVNSFELMSLLKRQMLERNRSAIIVSHNLDLSLKIADVIVVIHKNKDYGEIHSNEVFHLNGGEDIKEWVNASLLPIVSIKETLLKTL